MHNFVEGDTGSTLQVKCIDSVSSNPISLLDSTVQIKWIGERHCPEYRDMEIIDEVNGIVQYTFDIDELEAPSMNFDIIITDSDGRFVTCKNLVRVNVRRRVHHHHNHHQY